jgi:hypothetical protein
MVKISKTTSGVPGLSGVQWRKSSYSGGSGNCIEITTDVPGLIPVRDSKGPDGPVLLFTTCGFSDFVTAVLHGRLRTT